MVHIIKVYVQDQNNEQQIRRLAVSSEIIGNFNLLTWKIREIFPAIRSENFDITWKDSENDVIHMSSDEELAQALANAEEGLLKIYVKAPYIQNPKEQEVPKAKNTSNELHQLVVCDGCDKEVYGHRYKCLQCHNYDLCSTCNFADKHPEHDMIKLVKPVQIHRNWVFLGARKMWRSMFGRCPAFPMNRESNKESSPTKSEKPQDGKQPWQTVVDDLLKGDFVPAEKLVKENLGHFLNFVESFADVDVRIEKPPFGDVNNLSTKANCSKNKEEKTSPETKQSESSTTRESPVLNKAAQTPNEETKVSDAKSEPSPITDNSETINENTALTSDSAAASNISAPIKKVSSPTGLFSDFETSVNIDGWTLVHDNEIEKKESSVPVASGSNGGAIPKVNSMYPDISKTVQSGEICPEQVNVEPEQVNVKPEQVIVDETQNVTKPKETLAVSQDPEIINALIKMQAMGFTNEGGWLERLLITKNGNINSALDALYPNTRRN